MYFWACEEFRKIAVNPATILVLLGGIFAYGFLYNYMYQPNDVTNAPVVVVDHSKTELSRRFIRMINGTPQVNIIADGLDYTRAQDMMKQNKAVGIIYIPDRFESKIRKGEEAVIINYQSTTAFLYYLALQKAAAFAMENLNDAIRPDQLVFLPAEDAQALAQTPSPVKVVGKALYNYTEGYGSYLIPAVLMVIMFQTLMMVIAMVCGKERSSGSIRLYEPVLSSFGRTGRLILSKSMMYLCLYAIFSFFLLGLMPILFDLPRIGDPLVIIEILIPFFLATSFMGLAASVFYTDQDGPLLMIAYFSVGLIFLSGVSYPLELMPWYWRAAHYVFPAAPATLAFVKINSMGAGIHQVDMEYLTLWIQCLVYFPLACFAYRRNIKRSRPDFTPNRELPGEDLRSKPNV